MRHISDCAVKTFRYMNINIDVSQLAVQFAARDERFDEISTPKLNHGLAMRTLEQFKTFLPTPDEIAQAPREFREEVSIIATWLLAKGVNHYPVALEDMTENKEKLDKKRLH